MGDVIDLVAYRAQLEEDKRQERWDKQDEDIEEAFYRLPRPHANLPGGNRWVRPLPSGAPWPERDWEQG